MAEWYGHLKTGGSLQGEYNVTWNGKNDKGIDVASGTYLIKITAGDFVKSVKAILLK